MTDLQARIRARMVETDLGYATPCWVSDRGLNIWGYTSIRVAGVQVSTHRAAYEAFVGAIPEGMVIDHMCHDGRTCSDGNTCPHRRCCNPAHLEPVTGPENTARGWNALKPSCKHGHEFTPENTHVTKVGHRVCRRCAVIATLKYRRNRVTSLPVRGVKELPERTSDHTPKLVQIG